MQWEARITTDPDVLGGQPVVRGTRVAVELIIDLLASGKSEADILGNSPRVTPDDIHACLAYASEAVRFYRILPLHV